MRYIRSKNGEYSDLSRILEESVRQPLTSSCVPQNPVISAPYTTEQVYAQMGQNISCMDYWANSVYSMDTYHFAYEVETEDGAFVLFYGENVIKYIERTVTKREQNNLKGGLAHTSKIKDKPIEICDPIFFKHGDRFMREDKPDKHYINVYTTDEISNDLSMVTKVIEKGDLNSPKFSLTFKPEIVRLGQEKRCSTFFRAEIYRVSKCSTEIMIPSRSGWYNDEVFGWVFLERSRYKYLDNTNLPPAMYRRCVGRTNRTVNEVFGELKPMIEQNWQSKVLFGVRLISPLLLPLEMHGIKVRTIVEALVESVSDMNVATAILKTGDFEKYDTVSLNATDADINKEIDGAHDGVAAIIGPMTAAEVKQNEKKVNYIRNAAIGANGVDKNVMTIISLIACFSPENLSQDFVLTVGCSNMSDSINVKELRNLVLEFDSLYIPYIEDHFNNVKDSVEQCMAELVPDIINDKQGLYIAFHAVREVLSKYLGIELFSDEEFTYVKNLFKKNTSETVSPNYTVREQFLDVTHKLLNSGKFKIMELRDAHKDYPKKEIALILDRKNEFLSFPMAAMEIISGMIPTVKNTFELTGILKDCGTIKATPYRDCGADAQSDFTADCA